MLKKTQLYSNLTIAIPTFNRNEILNSNLINLFPQLDETCTLMIIDNHSETPVEKTIFPILPNNYQFKLKIHRNIENIGGNANILRCFEFCKTPYLWVLGDDDIPEPDAIIKIQAMIRQFPEFLFCHFKMKPEGPKEIFKEEKVVIGLNEFLESIDYFGEMIFISVGLYHIPYLLKELRYGMAYQGSNAPLLVLVIMALYRNPSLSVVFSEKILVKNGWDLTPVNLKWSVLSVAPGLPSLLTLPVGDDSIKHIQNLLRKSTKDFITPKAVFHQALLISITKRNHYSRRIHSVIRKNYFGVGSPSIRIEALIYQILLIFPRFSLFFFHILHRLLKGSKTGEHMISDLDRM